MNNNKTANRSIGSPVFLMLWLFGYLCVSSSLCAQTGEDLIKEADLFFEQEAYRSAAEIYKSLDTANPNNAFTLFKLGVCYYELGEFSPAEDYLLQALGLPERKQTVHLYLGKLYHALFDFEQAISHYKTFLKHIEVTDQRRRMVKDAIVRCSNGLMVRRQTFSEEVSLLDSLVNSPSDEYRPLPSPTYPNIFYYASSQRPNEKFELRSAEQVKEEWLVLPMMTDTTRDTSSRIPVGFGENGKAFTYFEGQTLFEGNLVTQQFNHTKDSTSLRYEEASFPVNFLAGDADIYFYNDTTLLFASRRAGGYGGLDIYISRYIKGEWEVPLNLGPSINSAYDERWPFLDTDGVTLYFSSNDKYRSIGGMDVFKTVFLTTTSRWTPAQNMGLLINAASDEEGFALTRDGAFAYFVSDRSTGFGGKDVYRVKLSQQAGGLKKRKASFLSQNTNRPTEQVPTKEIRDGDDWPEFQSIAYKTTDTLLTEAMKNDLASVASLMKKVPALKGTFVSYLPEGESSERVEEILTQVRGWLKEEGIQLKRMQTMVVSSKYAPTVDSIQVIDFFPGNPEILPAVVQFQQSSSTTFQYKYFKKTMNGLVFQVQVPLNMLTSEKELRQFYPDGFLFHAHSSEETHFAGGSLLTWASAMETENAFKKLGFADAKIVALLNGWLLEPSAAGHFLHAYPALEPYIDRH